ncbi:hypothetical protein K469DRAFT_702636 [Zopfia rhizophila CBS 207.26]|uniref:Uncharacterized protein n=1 Tax=Zopfia rhizophila CBS 207.26 TaxID=1314779 RepID=A0A6A6EDS2_9PEZI|nr:hypothetical protein K469DRAFT_702636 [Zopfia rhizophila CBS 207.26]
MFGLAESSPHTVRQTPGHRPEDKAERDKGHEDPDIEKGQGHREEHTDGRPRGRRR